MPLELTQGTFEAEVEKSTEPVLVDFWAPWCGPCRMMSGVIDAIEPKLAGKVKVCKVNVDENPELASKFQVSTIPTLMFYKSGQRVHSTVGALSEADLEKQINERLLA